MIPAYDSMPLSDEELAKRKAWPKWETIEYNTYRLPVPGGWLYRNTQGRGTMVFVPDVD